MRKNLAFLLLLVFIFTACGTPPANIPTSTEIKLSIPTPTPEPIKIPSPSEVGLFPTTDAGNNFPVPTKEAAQVENSQLISRDDLLTRLKLEGGVLDAYEAAIDVWLANNGINNTTTQYIFNSNLDQWRIIKRETNTGNIIGTVGSDQPFNIDVEVNGVVTIKDTYEAIVFPNTGDAEPRLIGQYAMIFSAPTMINGINYFTSAANFFHQEPKLIPDLIALATLATLASSTPDPKFHELTQDEIDNIDVRNYVKYIKISSAEKQQYADYIANDLKIGPGVKPAKLSESFTDFGYQEIQLNLSANRNIVPRFALEIDDVRTTVYEVKIQNPDGTVYQGAFFVSNADTVSNGIESWRFNGIIRKFQNGSHKEFIIWLILGTPQSNNAAKNPYATKLTNVVGKEDTWDPMRTQLIDLDTFTPDMSSTIWWAKPMT